MKERQILWVADIVEFPTALGSRCALLRVLGLDAYTDTEEELLDALTDSARRPELLEVCLEDSRCRVFWEEFQKGCTPYADRDPIRLLEYEGRYWAVEGKHRVCLAKRAGVEFLEAVVYHLKEDIMTLLPSEGRPGRFCFRFSYSISRGVEEIQGKAAFLWVDHPGLLWGTFFGWAWLDASQDTGGQWKEILPGVRYRVSVSRELERRAFFRIRQRFTVESEVEIMPQHPKTKIWLLEVPVRDIASVQSGPAGPSCFGNVYRFGCWRRHHLRQLNRIHLRLF